jgi:TRAP-type C4-dicarboxylate transport system permease small subunit
MLFVGGLKFVLKVHPVGSATLGIPKSYWYGAVSVGLLLMTLHSLVNFWLLLRTGKAFSSELADEVEGVLRTDDSARELELLNKSEAPS